MGFSDADMGILSEYKSSLNDLDFNSKPMINMLTMLAEDNESLADGIVNIIKERIIQVSANDATYIGTPYHFL